MSIVLPSTFREGLMAWLGQHVVVYLKNVSEASLVGVPHPPPLPYDPCPPYPQPPTPPTPTPVAGGGNITGGTPIVPGAPGPTGNVGPITGSGFASMALWICPPKPGEAVGTGVVSGTLRFVGTDYIIIGVPVGGVCRDLIIPFNAIGMVVAGCLA